jgi:2-polyprenyl-3-methyl-5-hydroxy-6-metoxy-1,4-benzoquinol methylase
MGGRLQRSGQAGVASIADADAEMAPRLESLAHAYNYTSWIFGLVEPHLGDEVLEVGAGHGTFTEILRDRGARVVATDVSDRCADLLRARFAGDAGVSVVQGGAEAVAGMPPFDCAVLINVLEHIKDDDGRPGHLVGARVPASLQRL